MTGPKMSADELRELSKSFRTKPTRLTDDELVRKIEIDVEEYRRILADHPEQLPVAPLDKLLPLMGWLIYESSRESVQRIGAGFDRLAEGAERRVLSEEALGYVNRLANAARGLPWPEFAPRSLGAIRSQALAESKRDTKEGFDAALTLHEEGRKRYLAYRDSYGADPAHATYALALDEVLLQLALAETGTACRTAERVVGRWTEEFADPDAEKSRADEEAWIQRMFLQLTDGLEVGELAIKTAQQIRDEHGFVDSASESRLALRTALQNPGIMTARAALLLLALWPGMESLGRRPGGFETWEDWEANLLARFTCAYRAIEAKADAAGGDPVAMRPEFQRQFVHVRLDLALLKPGFELRSEADFAPCLAVDPLDGTAVDALSEWLVASGDSGRWRGFGAAVMPAFIRSIVACRALGPEDRGYQEWREKYFAYDQFAAEDGRKERVAAALAAAG